MHMWTLLTQSSSAAASSDADETRPSEFREEGYAGSSTGSSEELELTGLIKIDISTHTVSTRPLLVSVLPLISRAHLPHQLVSSRPFSQHTKDHRDQAKHTSQGLHSRNVGRAS
jgi:hypothetical protein